MMATPPELAGFTRPVIRYLFSRAIKLNATGRYGVALGYGMPCAA
jgi:hypothetical protein